MNLMFQSITNYIHDSFQGKYDISPNNEYNRYMSFYHERQFYNKFYERKADIMSHNLWLKAGYDLENGIKVYDSIKDYVGEPRVTHSGFARRNYNYDHSEMAKLLLDKANLDEFQTPVTNKQ